MIYYLPYEQKYRYNKHKCKCELQRTACSLKVQEDDCLDQWTCVAIAQINCTIGSVITHTQHLLTPICILRFKMVNHVNNWTVITYGFSRSVIVSFFVKEIAKRQYQEDKHHNAGVQG